MTFEHGPGQQGSHGHPAPPPGQPAPPPQGAPQPGTPGQIPLPPQGRKPTHNRRHGWLYVVLGAVFVLVGALGFVGDTRGAALNWVFIALGLANAAMGASALRHARTTIDPFGDPGRRRS